MCADRAECRAGEHPGAWSRSSGRARRIGVLAGAVGACLLAFAAPAAAVGAHAPAAGGTSADVVVRDLLLVANAIVAGVLLLRPLAGPLTKPARTIAFAAGGVAALADVGSGVPLVLGTVLGLATLAAPLTASRAWAALPAGVLLTGLLTAEAVSGLRGPELAAGVAHSAAATVLTGAAVLLAAGAPDGRRGAARRLAPAASAAVLVVAGTGVAQAVANGLGADQRLVRTPYGLVVLAECAALAIAVVLGVVAWRRPGGFAGHGVLLGLVVALVLGGTSAALPRPGPEPVPGSPLLGRVALDGDRAVLVAPQRPGKNLVHVDDGAAIGSDAPLTVTADDSPVVALTRRPGAEGWWAVVDLPAGWGTLRIRERDRDAGLRFDTGNAPGPPTALTGPDGPECAEALLGALAAGTRPAAGPCPADRLAPADAELLGDTVRFVAGRGWRELTLVGDSSRRSAEGERAVRAAAAAAGIAVRTPAAAAGPVLVVAGRPAAAAALTGIAAGRLPGTGAYLARWLVTAPLLDIPAGQLVALPYSPNDALPLRYQAELRRIFPGANAGADGYERWCSAGAVPPERGPASVYAMSWLTWSPQEFQHGGHGGGDGASWLPHGAITLASGPISRAGSRN
jgi:hypothetical protein